MKLVLKALLLFSLFFTICTPASAGWKEKIAENQMKALQYISQLKEGANPDTISRPIMRRDDKYSAKKANSEIRDAMTEAENLARQGKNKSIKIPDFETKLLTDEGYIELKKKYGIKDN